MKQEPFVIEKTFDASPENIWKAISDRDTMKLWYFDLDEFKPEAGFEFRFFGGTEKKQYLHLCKVIEAVPGKILSYSWCYDGYPGYSVVRFELFSEGKKTRLKLTHQGIESFPENETDFAISNFSAGWTHIVTRSLAGYLEKTGA